MGLKVISLSGDQNQNFLIRAYVYPAVEILTLLPLGLLTDGLEVIYGLYYVFGQLVMILATPTGQTLRGLISKTQVVRA